MSSKFKQILDAANDRLVEPEAEEVTQPVVKEVSSQKKSRAAGKLAHPDYEQISAYIRKETHLVVKQRLVGSKQDFSDLLPYLVEKWLQNEDDNEA